MQAVRRRRAGKSVELRGAAFRGATLSAVRLDGGRGRPVPSPPRAAAIKAGDCCGSEGFQVMARTLEETGGDFAMVGYLLRETLSDHGSVARGLCRLDGDGYLETVVEHLKLERRGEAAVDRRIDADI